MAARFTIEADVPLEMSLVAADLVHDTRVALDHVLAALKEHFGGDPGKGSFPVCATTDGSAARVESAGRRGPLRGLENEAVDLVRRVQPMHAGGSNDPLVALDALDNADKHRLLQRSFVYPADTAQTGPDLIIVTRPERPTVQTSLRRASERLNHGTALAKYLVRGCAQDPLRARQDAPIGFTIGELDAPKADFTAMTERVNDITDLARDELRRAAA